MCDVIDSKTFLHFQFIFFLSQSYKGFYKVVATCCHTKSIEYKIQFENIKWGKDFFFAIRTIHFWYLAWIETGSLINLTKIIIEDVQNMWY